MHSNTTSAKVVPRYDYHSYPAMMAARAAGGVAIVATNGARKRVLFCDE